MVTEKMIVPRHLEDSNLGDVHCSWEPATAALFMPVCEEVMSFDVLPFPRLYPDIKV